LPAKLAHTMPPHSRFAALPGGAPGICHMYVNENSANAGRAEPDTFDMAAGCRLAWSLCLITSLSWHQPHTAAGCGGTEAPSMCMGSLQPAVAHGACRPRALPASRPNSMQQCTSAWLNAVRGRAQARCSGTSCARRARWRTWRAGSTMWPPSPRSQRWPSGTAPSGRARPPRRARLRAPRGAPPAVRPAVQSLHSCQPWARHAVLCGCWPCPCACITFKLSVPSCMPPVRSAHASCNISR